MTTITRIGVWSERCRTRSGLCELLKRGPSEQGLATLREPVIALCDGTVSLTGEDRAYLSPAAIGLTNALIDAFGSLGDLASLANEDLAIFAATDQTELDLSGLRRLFGGCQNVEEGFARFNEIRRYIHPFDTLRMLSTNPVYYASKVIGAHGGGYPVRAMSLSGLCALEDANDGLTTGRVARAAVVAFGNMLSYEALVTFTKLGLIAKDGDSQVDPTYAAVALCLQRGEGDPALADLLAVRSFYDPRPCVPPETWRAMLEDAADRVGGPDYVVTYDNGSEVLRAIEQEALRQVFPSVETRNYKRFLGYTGKANNLLDLAAVLNDPTVEHGATVLVCGAGLAFGVGYLAVRKREPSA